MKRKAKKPGARAKKPSVRPATSADRPRCGLCGKTENLTRTECCGNWICDDESNYVMFSYARTSCYRNHDRYTLCASHYHEGHEGSWKDCPKCRENIEPEMYVEFGTNEYNFEKLENPPSFEPTHCTGCGRVIKLADGGYMQSAEGIFCGKCKPFDLPDFTQAAKKRRK